MTLMSRYELPCGIDGCTRKVHGRSHYCSTHHYKDHTHGHPLQDPVHPALKEPIKRITQWEKTAEGRKAVDAATDHYVKLGTVRLAEWRSDIEQAYETGVKLTSPHRETTEIVARTFEGKDHRKTVRELLALGILLEESPGCFRSDTSFTYEVGQVYMRGSPALTQFKYRKGRGMIAKTRYLKRKTRVELGKYLTQNFVYLGVLMHREWNRKAKADQKAKADLIATFTA